MKIRSIVYLCGHLCFTLCTTYTCNLSKIYSTLSCHVSEKGRKKSESSRKMKLPPKRITRKVKALLIYYSANTKCSMEIWSSVSMKVILLLAAHKHQYTHSCYFILRQHSHAQKIYIEIPL